MLCFSLKFAVILAKSRFLCLAFARNYIYFVAQSIYLVKCVEKSKAYADCAILGRVESLVREGRAMIARSQAKALAGEYFAHSVGGQSVYIE